MSNIKTFAQRQKAEHIYNTYFNPDSEHCIDFNLLDTLDFYGAISRDEFHLLTEKFDSIGNRLFKEIKKFDKKQL